VWLVWHETELARILFWVSDTLMISNSAWERSVRRGWKKREQSGDEALAVHFDDGAKDETFVRNESSKEDIYICYRLRDSYIRVSKSLWLLDYKHPESNRKIVWRNFFFSFFKFSFILLLSFHFMRYHIQK